MGGYALRLLGPPEVRQDGLPLAFKSRKALALLAYLTLEAHPCARETLAGLLWPDSEPEVARSALRTTLSQLRGLLGNRMTVTKQTVALTWTDEDDLDLHRLAAGDPDVWRGELLEGVQLSSEDFESWLTGQREAVRAQADRAFDRSSAGLLETDALGASEVASRWLSLDRLNEVAWRRLILARLALGQLGPAREAFETCRTMISSETGLDLAPETLALQARLHPEVPLALTPVDLPAFLVGGPLVGRQAEFAQLVEAYRLAASGAPQVVLISGEPGIGKTRLAGELLAWARERGAPLLRGRGLEGAFAPFAPLVEALRREVPTLRTRLGSTARSDLSRLLPEVHDGPPPEPTGNPQAQTLAALCAACLALTPQRDTLNPLVLLIDDLQWTDASSRDALLRLAAHLADGPRPLLLLFTARAEYLGTGSPLSGWLAKLRRHLPLQDLRLVSLDASDTAHLLARSVPRLSGSVQTKLASWLYTQTAGHPLYLTEMVKSLLESGALREGELDEERLPMASEGLRAAIGERLARLTPASLALAQGSAVLGQGAQFETLRSVADLDEVTALTGYEELLQVGLLLEHGEIAQLSHDRVRETLRDALSSPRRRLLHSRTFRVLETLDAPPAVLAEHALNGGLREEAAIWFERAAEAADDVGALAESVAAAQTALRLIPAERQHHVRRYILVQTIFFGIGGGISGDVRAALAFVDQHIQSLPGDLREERAMCLAFHAMYLSVEGKSGQDFSTLDDLLEEAMKLDNPYVTQVIYNSQVAVNIMAWEWDRAERALDGYEKGAREDQSGYDPINSEALRLVIEANRDGYEKVFGRQVDLVVRALDFYVEAALPLSGREYFFLATVRAMRAGALCVEETETIWQIYKLIEEKLGGSELKLRVAEGIGLWLTTAGEYADALPYLRQADTLSWWYSPGNLMLHTSAIAKCLVHLGNVEEAEAMLSELSPAELQRATRNEFGFTSGNMADAYLALSNPTSALFHYHNALTSYDASAALSSLGCIAQILNTEDPQLAAYCLGAVLAGKVTRLRDRQQAEAILADLRAHGPAEEIEAALGKGAATPLREVVEHVRAALSRRPVHVPAI